MRVAIAGTGISGLTVARLLHPRHEITVFEALPRIGGHSHTVDVEAADTSIAVDTGFIVYNEKNYPLLTRLLSMLEVPTQASDMSFSASIGRGALEYAGSSLRSLLAQPRNALRPSFLRMLQDIGRFNRLGRRLVQVGADDLALGQLIDREGFGHLFRHAYLLPMAAAIWSAPTDAILAFPADRFLRFFDNHGLLSVGGHHRWRTVTGGSRTYVERLAAPFRHRIATGTAVLAARRSALGVHLRLADGRQQRFDRLVLAIHADQALALIEDADPEERSILGSFRFLPNRAVLHRDARLMPRRRAAWASWNYLAEGLGASSGRVSVTYWMNRLQGIDPRAPLFVSLNPLIEPDPARVLRELAYDHPLLDRAAIAAQSRMTSIQGRGGIWYAGAWLGDGFHEDGVRSGVALAADFGVVPPWSQPVPDTERRGATGLPERAAAMPV